MTNYILKEGDCVVPEIEGVKVVVATKYNLLEHQEHHILKNVFDKEGRKVACGILCEDYLFDPIQQLIVHIKTINCKKCKEEYERVKHDHKAKYTACIDQMRVSVCDDNLILDATKLSVGDNVWMLRKEEERASKGTVLEITEKDIFLEFPFADCGNKLSDDKNILPTKNCCIDSLIKKKELEIEKLNQEKDQNND